MALLIGLILPWIKIHPLFNSPEEYAITVPDQLLPYLFSCRISVKPVVEQPDVFICKRPAIAGKGG
jgi:hypothetical protein